MSYFDARALTSHKIENCTDITLYGSHTLLHSQKMRPHKNITANDL